MMDEVRFELQGQYVSQSLGCAPRIDFFMHALSYQ